MPPARAPGTGPARAYLSTQEPNKRGVFARSRIGRGPWYNARGELIAVDLDQLHISPNIYQRTALDEKGNEIKGRYSKPNEHDILTGTQADGTAYFPWQKGDKTCKNWTSSGEGSATVGHHDRHGGGNTSWNAAHASRGVQPGKPAGHRRRRPLLLLRGGLNRSRQSLRNDEAPRRACGAGRFCWVEGTFYFFSTALSCRRRPSREKVECPLFR